MPLNFLSFVHHVVNVKTGAKGGSGKRFNCDVGTRYTFYHEIPKNVVVQGVSVVAVIDEGKKDGHVFVKVLGNMDNKLHANFDKQVPVDQGFQEFDAFGYYSMLT
ncbi:hypothetical protein BUALT_Bualt14G0000100 [Buddleja alternifolia]|uniref:Uncharacterized protein n=1 Tax=Buddleja alternifolia TaxID=168488 RepID=A0AAV6WF12_9LAMI|nr:hypothetical protein BUALT_Bualt14G0000100 [Buddleja alternifolia]